MGIQDSALSREWTPWMHQNLKTHQSHQHSQQNTSKSLATSQHTTPKVKQKIVGVRTLLLADFPVNAWSVIGKAIQLFNQVAIRLVTLQLCRHTILIWAVCKASIKPSPCALVSKGRHWQIRKSQCYQWLNKKSTVLG